MKARELFILLFLSSPLLYCVAAAIAYGFFDVTIMYWPPKGESGRQLCVLMSYSFFTYVSVVGTFEYLKDLVQSYTEE